MYDWPASGSTFFCGQSLAGSPVWETVLLIWEVSGREGRGVGRIWCAPAPISRTGCVPPPRSWFWLIECIPWHPSSPFRAPTHTCQLLPSVVSARGPGPPTQDSAVMPTLPQTALECAALASALPTPSRPLPSTLRPSPTCFVVLCCRTCLSH